MRGLLLLLAVADLPARFQLAQVPGVDFIVGGHQSLAPAGIREAPLGDINWQSAPAEVTPLAPDPHVLDGARVLLSDTRGEPLVAVRGHTVVLLVDATGPLVRWPYFNYLLHVAACEAAGRAPPRFAAWPGSPMPHAGGKRVIAAALLAMWLLAFLLYGVARRRGRAHPTAADDFFSAVNRNATTGSKADEAWARAGFARPLAGLLTLLAAMLLLIGPYFGVQSLLASRVQPFPEADGLWGTTWDALWVAWLTFDLGTQYAFVKYFAEHRVTHPKDALADVQFYVWWQVFARLLEASVLCGLALGYLPWTRYAIYAPFVALYGGCYSVGIFGVGKLTLQALQRFDYFNLLDMLEYRLLKFAAPIGFVLIGRAWGRAHPMYGEAFGAAIGLGLGQLGTNLLMAGLGLGALVYLRVPLGPLFLAQFDRRIFKRQVIYGLKLTLAQEPYRLTSMIESIIIVRWLADFTYWLGIKDLLYSRIQWLFFFAWAFYQSLLPAISEALGAGKRVLAQYYVARFFQFGYLFSAAMFSLLMAVGPTFIHGALGPQWGRAADFLLLSVLSGLLLPPAWISDAVQWGAGRTGLNVIVMLIEQTTRLALMYLLITRYQFVTIYIASLVAMGLKAVVALSANHKLILPLRVPLWTCLFAPLCAGAVNYGVWALVARHVPPSHAIALFFIGGAFSFVVTFFACGLLGGYDEDALAELDSGAQMSALVRPLCLILSGSARLGARLSPIPSRRLALAQNALAEAAELDAAARLTASQ